MEPLPAMPELTALDATTQLVAAAVYLAVGAAALGQAPRDIRTRVFCAMAVAHAVAFSIPAAAWFFGITDVQAFNRIPLGIVMASLSTGALLMFHFSQVFPQRRAWIRGSGIQLPIGYVITPLAVFLLVRWWALTKPEMTAKFGLAFILFGFPLMVLLGLVLPVASIVSLLRSLRELTVTKRVHPAIEPGESAGGPLPNARPTIVGILVSQLAGGAVALLVLGPLNKVAPESLAVTLVALTVWMLGLLTPLAFAAGVWKYRVLEIPPDGRGGGSRSPSAEVQPD